MTTDQNHATSHEPHPPQRATEIRLHVDADTMERIRAYARREGISESEAVHDAIEASFGNSNASTVPRFRREHDCY